MHNPIKKMFKQHKIFEGGLHYNAIQLSRFMLHQPKQIKTFLIGAGLLIENDKSNTDPDHTRNKQRVQSKSCSNSKLKNIRACLLKLGIR